MTLAEARANVGKTVSYLPAPARETGCEPQEGVISSVGRVNVFVSYGPDPQPRATRPEDLTLVAGGES